ncbi:hypothetical protein CDD80_3586 [Ophiocordyceps camponoti-rufipedis]|uniref:Cytochrome P450 n=1 Tax=Ophiocordyceps camponoti-rufipedis TaxID=2004952 RepID=A0A2C5ZJ17_9HYPO|nr:hypothetical protein CDD80_3586 [Ophiocordyceps camponoti-rufipedis]
MIGWWVLAAVVACRLVLCIYRIWFHPLSKFPGPWIHSASYLPYLYRNHVTWDWIKQMPQLHRTYGPVVRIGPNHLSVDGSLAWPEIIANRSSSVEYPKQPGYLGPRDDLSLTGCGLTPRRKHHRRLIARAFRERDLRDQEPTMSGHVDLLVQRIRDYSDNDEAFNLVDWFTFLTFDVFGHVVFCESFECLTKEAFRPLALMRSKAVKEFGTRKFFLIYFSWDVARWLWTKSPFIRNFWTVEKEIRQRAMHRISLGTEGRSDRSDLMSHLLMAAEDKSAHAMTQDEVLSNTTLLIVAAGETTLPTLSGLFFYLGQNRQVYKTVSDEIRGLFRQKPQSIDYISGVALPYLNACIQETMRVYPPVPELSTRISPGHSIDGRFVPAGTHVSLYMYSTSRNPHSFTDPDSFRPERWLPGNAEFQGDHPDVSKPFSCGPRDCVGKTMALQLIRLTAVRLLCEFDFDLLPGQEDWQERQRASAFWEVSPLRVKFRPYKENNM